MKLTCDLLYRGITSREYIKAQMTRQIDEFSIRQRFQLKSLKRSTRLAIYNLNDLVSADHPTWLDVPILVKVVKQLSPDEALALGGDAVNELAEQSNNLVPLVEE